MTFNELVETGQLSIFSETHYIIKLCYTNVHNVYQSVMSPVHYT